MKTVVFLHPHFLKPAGASKVVLEFASRLQKQSKFKIKIITIASNPKVILPYPNLDITNLGGPTTGSIFFWLTFPVFFKKLKNVLNQIPNKIIFAHSLSIYWSYAYYLIYPKTPNIIYFHDLGFPYSDSESESNSLPTFYRFVARLINPFFRLVNRRIINSQIKLIANSQTSANYLFHKYHRHTDAIITPGIDSKLFKPSIIKEKYFYTVGRLEKIKQIDKIILAFAKFNNPKYRLKIIGDGIEKESLKKLAIKLNLANQIDFLGNLESHQITPIAPKALMGIFNCPHESFGLSILESLACGTPVITINQGGGIEFVINNLNGYLSDGTPSSIAKLIPKIIKNNQTLSLNAIKKSRGYDWNIKTKELSQYLTSLS